ARALRRQGRVLGAAATLQLTAQVRDHVDGLGPLQALTGPGVTDLLVNEDGSVWVDDADGLHRAPVRLGRAQARDLAVRLATSAGRRLDDAVPWADAHLPSGIRFHAVLPPLSTGGAILSLRLPGGPELDLDALERLGSLTAEVREVLRAIICARVPFLITGGTGTGKSTLLAAMLAEAPATERTVVVEDVPELDIEHPHAVPLPSRHANTDGAGRETPNGWWWSRTASNSTSTILISSTCSPATPTPKGPERWAFPPWCARACECGRTGSCWASAAAGRSASCCRP